MQHTHAMVSKSFHEGSYMIRSKEFSGYEYARSSVYTTYSRLNKLGLNAGKSVRENLTSHRYTGQ